MQPVRPTLEEYFFRLINREKESSHAVEGRPDERNTRNGRRQYLSRSGARPRLYNLIFFALMMIGAAILVGHISIGIERLVIVNLGPLRDFAFGLVMAIFIGVGLIYKEMEKRTLYSLLAKPIRRWQFLVGKFGGLLLTLVVNTSLMAIGLAVALFYVAHKFYRRRHHPHRHLLCPS